MNDQYKTADELAVELELLQARFDALESNYAESKRVVKLYNELNALKEKLLLPGDLDSKLRLITQWLIESFQAQSARIWALEPEDTCDSDCVYADAAQESHPCCPPDGCLRLIAGSGRSIGTDGHMLQRLPVAQYAGSDVAQGSHHKFISNDVAVDPQFPDGERGGEVCPVSFACYGLRSTRGRPIGVLDVFGDQAISSDADVLLEGLANSAAHLIQKGMTEAALKSEKTFIESALDTLTDLFVVFDFQGKFLRWNRAVRDITGYRDDEIVTLKPTDLVSKQDAPRVTRATQVILRDGHGVMEAMVVTKKGEHIPFEFTGDLLRNHGGKPDTICVVGRDITERKRAAEALVESEENYRSLMEAAPDPIIVYDVEGRVTYVNPAFTRLFGWAMEELIGKTMDDFVPEGSLSETRAAVERVLRGHTVLSVETRRRTKDGRIIEIQGSASPLKGRDGKPAGTIVIHRDVTEAKRMERALRRSEEEYRCLYQESESTGKLYRTLLDASPDPIVVYDIKGIPMYLNPAFTDVFGWTFKEVRGKPIDFVPPENWTETREYIQKVLNGERFSDFRTRRYTKDGVIIDVSLSGAVFLKKTVMWPAA